MNHRWDTIISRCRAAFPEMVLGRIDEALDLAERAGMREAMLYALTGNGRAWAASGQDESAAILLAFADSEHNPYQEYATPILKELAERIGPARMDAARDEASKLDLATAVRLIGTNSCGAPCR